MTNKLLCSTISGKSTVSRHAPLSIRLGRVASAMGALLLMTGCSSMLNIGSPDYACPGMPGGVQCMSARDVYTATNNGNVPLPMLRAGQEAGAEKAAVTGVTAQGGQSGAQEVNGNQSAPNDVVANYVAPRLPDQPIPIRTPAQVMRIWVAPWEGTNGDLNTTGYIYTEIEPRRWVIGDAVEQSAPVLRPLQTIRHGNEPRQEAHAGATPGRRAAEAAHSKAATAHQ